METHKKYLNENIKRSNENWKKMEKMLDKVWKNLYKDIEKDFPEWEIKEMYKKMFEDNVKKLVSDLIFKSTFDYNRLKLR